MRILLFIKELLRISTNYDENLLSVIKGTLTFNTASWIIITITVLSFGVI